MTKPVNIGEVLTLNDESMYDEPPSKKPICSEFQKKKMKHICNIKNFHTVKMNSSLHQSIPMQLQ